MDIVEHLRGYEPLHRSDRFAASDEIERLRERLRVECSDKHAVMVKAREECIEICKEVMRYHIKKAESIDDELERAFRDGESCGAEDCAVAIRYGIAEWLGST